MQLPGPNSNENLLAGVTALRDALQKILNGSDPGLAFLKLAGLGDHKIAFGTGSATWTASQFSAVTTISHGLGAVPVFWIAFSVDAGQVITFFTGGAPTTTQVGFQGWAAAARTATNNFVWLAIA